MRAFDAFGAADEDFTKEILPILDKNCFECHGPEKHKGDLILTTYTNYTQVTEARETWQKVLEMVQAFEMPPKGKKELNFNDHGKLLRWLRRLPKPERPDCDQIASDRTANFYKGYVMSRRLNRAEYHNTLRDLLGVELHLEHLLPADGGGGEGFDTSGNALFTSSIHIEKYMAAAEHAFEVVFVAPQDALEQRVAQHGFEALKTWLHDRRVAAVARLIAGLDFFFERRAARGQSLPLPAISAVLLTCR